MSTPFDTRQSPEPLAWGIPQNWNTRIRLTPSMYGATIPLGAVALTTAVTSFLRQDYLVGTLFGIVCSAIAWRIAWRRLPTADVVLPTPEAEQHRSIAFDRNRWNGPRGASAVATGGGLLMILGTVLLAIGVRGHDRDAGTLGSAGLFLAVLGLLTWFGGKAQLMRFRAEPDSMDVVLTTDGVRAGGQSPLLAWDSITSFEPTIDVVSAGRGQRRVPRIKIHTPTEIRAIDVAAYRQHPVAMLNILEFYRTHPAERVEIGTEASVLRGRRITAAIDPRVRR